MKSDQHRTAGFVRGFFLFLDSNKIRSAVIHGGDDGFERELSDVDFVVSHETFGNLPSLIHTYCKGSAWRLCQILRHETTAAYFVCSAEDDPACVVALDACSDYQRNGTRFLGSEEMLLKRRELSWQGHGLTAEMELRYRFAKASAKIKSAIECEKEFANYPEKTRSDCAAWLNTKWGISIQSWDAKNLEQAFAKLRHQAKKFRFLTAPGSLRRIFDRIIHPTGLVVIVGENEFDQRATHLSEVFGKHYFRRYRKSKKFNFRHLLDLIASTLIVLPESKSPWLRFTPKNCLYRFESDDGENQYDKLALHLHHRCLQRIKSRPPL